MSREDDHVSRQITDLKKTQHYNKSVQTPTLHTIQGNEMFQLPAFINVTFSLLCRKSYRGWQRNTFGCCAYARQCKCHLVSWAFPMSDRRIYLFIYTSVQFGETVMMNNTFWVLFKIQPKGSQETLCWDVKILHIMGRWTRFWRLPRLKLHFKSMESQKFAEISISSS